MNIYKELIHNMFDNDLTMVHFEQLKATKDRPNIWCFINQGWASSHGLRPLIRVMNSGKNLNIVIIANDKYTYTTSASEIDLGAIAMTFPKVYVASVALKANKAQTKAAFDEAVSYKGTSIILAYEFIPESDFDAERHEQLTQAIVNSGQWLLYRNNPELAQKNFNSFKLDSEPPSISIKAYINLKDPFVELLGNDFLDYEHKIKTQQKKVDRRFDKHLALSSIAYINRSKLLQNGRIRRTMFPKK
ncbi:MAG: hypothetical protein AAFX55_15510 [Bacteroidota bacterium]